VGVPKMLSVN